MGMTSLGPCSIYSFPCMFNHMFTQKGHMARSTFSIIVS